MTKRKKIILAALGTLFALNIAATLIGGRIDAVKSDVSAEVAAAGKTSADLSQKIDALGERLLRLEEQMRAQNQSELDHLQKEIARLSAYAKQLEEKR